MTTVPEQDGAGPTHEPRPGTDEWLYADDVRWRTYLLGYEHGVRAIIDDVPRRYTRADIHAAEARGYRDGQIQGRHDQQGRRAERWAARDVQTLLSRARAAGRLGELDRAFPEAVEALLAVVDDEAWREHLAGPA